MTELLDMHHGAVLAANARQGPGRGPASTGHLRWWWVRWAMHDGLLLDALDRLTPQSLERLYAVLPAEWPSPASGLLSVRQMAWIRALVDGRHLDSRQAGFL